MSRQELEKLAEKYGMDIGKLERLSQHVTSPSIKNNSAVRSVRKEDGEEEVSVMVRAFFPCQSTSLQLNISTGSLDRIACL